MHAFVHALWHWFIHDSVRQDIMSATYTFTHVKGTFEIPDTFPNTFHVFKGQIPASYGIDHTRVISVEHTTKTTLTDKSTLRQSRQQQ